MSDLEHKSGYEYLRYLKFTVDKEDKKIIPEGKYYEIFLPKLGLPLKAGSQWSDTKTEKKIEQGLKLYKIELPDFADRRSEIHKQLSSTAHGNKNTINTLIRTPEENIHKLEEDLTRSIAFFEATLESALKCYVRLYLGRNADHGEIVKSMFHNFQVQNYFYSKTRKYVYTLNNNNSANTLTRWRGFLTSPM